MIIDPNETSETVVMRTLGAPPSAPREAIIHLRSLLDEEEATLASSGNEDWAHIQENRGPRKEVNDYSRDY